MLYKGSLIAVFDADFIPPAGFLRAVVGHFIDPEVGIALLLGPMIYCHIFVTKTGRKAPRNLETPVVAAFLAAFGTEKRKPSHR